MMYKGPGAKAETELLQCRRQANSDISLHGGKENKQHKILQGQWRQRVSETPTLGHQESRTLGLDAEIQQCRHEITKQKHRVKLRRNQYKIT